MAEPTLSPEAIEKLKARGFLQPETAQLALERMGKAAQESPELARRDREMAARMTPEQARKIMPMREFFSPPAGGDSAAAPATSAAAAAAPARREPTASEREAARTQRIMGALEQGYAGSQPGQGVVPMPRDWKVPDHVKQGRYLVGLNLAKLQPGDLDAPPNWPAPPRQPDHYDQLIGQIIGGQP